MAKRKIAKNNRGFKGIWIPAEYWLDENLKPMEMLFLVEIDSLDINGQGCFASNAHFADFFGVSKARCTQIINELVSKGYITNDLKYDGKQIVKRTLRVVNKFNTPIKKIKSPIKKTKYPYLENYEGSNTYISNTYSNNNILSSSQANNDDDPIRTISQSSYAKDVIYYLNQKTGKSYRYTTAKTRKLLNARFNEGFQIADFQKVIDNKVAEWGDDEKMNRFLRPETLFGTKFEGYLNEQPKKEVARKKDIPDYLQRF